MSGIRRYSEVIGAVLAKKMAHSGFDGFNQRDLKKAVNGFAEDATYIVPGNISISGITKGKPAIEALFAKMLEHYPKMHFSVKEVFVSNIFAMGATNNVAVEYDLAYTNREGKEFHNSGVSIVRVKGGKVVSMHDYIFNLNTSKEAWGKD
jgi:ketosteroid isomerase-like protein